MEKFIFWKRKPFSRTYTLLTNDAIVGQLTTGMWGNKANGEYGNLKVTFVVKGIFNRPMYFLNRETGELMGSAKFYLWRRRGIITLADHSEYIMRYWNIWRSRWTISDSNEILINYVKSFLKGNITTETDNGLLILAGLYMNHYLTTRYGNHGQSSFII